MGSPSTRKVVLATGDGHYLYRSDMQKDWNRLLASRGEENLQRDYPLRVANSILSGKNGTVTKGMSDIISYAPLFGSGNPAHLFAMTSSFAVPIIVFESESADVVLGPVRTYALTYVAFLALFLASAVALGLIATRQITRPIAALQRGAEIIAQGNYGNALKVETHDEIEKLADQFNIMASSLRAHEQEIQRHRTQLEEMVRQRTLELQEEKGKLAGGARQCSQCLCAARQIVPDSDSERSVCVRHRQCTAGRRRDAASSDSLEILPTITESPWKRAAATGEIETLVQQLNDEGKSPRYS